MIAFFLGAHPEVSLAELRIVLGVKETLFYRNVAIFDVDLSDEQLSSIFFELGGSTRAGRVVTDLPINVTEERLAKVMTSEIEKIERKQYTLSLYGVKIDKKVLHKEVKDLLKGCKYDGNIRENQHSPASAFHVVKRGGVEFSILGVGESSLLIRTVQLADPAYWTKIDVERPGRDMKIGILPAKLARVMVSLSKVDSSGILWDPFVGQATIAMQASVLGIPVYGTDKSRQSLDLGWQNMDWLKASGLALNEKVTFDKQAIEDAKPMKGITGIATEPFLGKPRFKAFSSFIQAKREWKKIMGVYAALLRQGQRRLSSGQYLVFVKPMYGFLEARQFEWYNPPLSISSAEWKVPELIEDLGNLVWKQRDSVVARTIMVLEKK